MEPAFDTVSRVGLIDSNPITGSYVLLCQCGVASVWLWRSWTKLDVSDDSPSLHRITQSGSVSVLGRISQLGGVPRNQHLMQCLALVRV